jgi:hypothetical protein
MKLLALDLVLFSLPPCEFLSHFFHAWEPDYKPWKMRFIDANITMRDRRVPSPYIPLAGRNQVFRASCAKISTILTWVCIRGSRMNLFYMPSKNEMRIKRDQWQDKNISLTSNLPQLCIYFNEPVPDPWAGFGRSKLMFPYLMLQLRTRTYGNTDSGHAQWNSGTKLVMTLNRLDTIRESVGINI